MEKNTRGGGGVRKDIDSAGDRTQDPQIKSHSLAFCTELYDDVLSDKGIYFIGYPTQYALYWFI